MTEKKGVMKLDQLSKLRVMFLGSFGLRVSWLRLGNGIIEFTHILLWWIYTNTT